jgi:hypothetical protein
MSITFPPNYPSWKQLGRYIRTCQECDHEAEYKAVETYASDAWKDVKCKACKSDALDYGSWRHSEGCGCLYCQKEREDFDE